LEKQNPFSSILFLALAFFLCLTSGAQAAPSDTAQFTQAINRVANASVDVKSLDDLPKSIKSFYQPDINVADRLGMHVATLDSMYAKPGETHVKVEQFGQNIAPGWPAAYQTQPKADQRTAVKRFLNHETDKFYGYDAIRRRLLH
jgi:hypothetical protein